MTAKLALVLGLLALTLIPSSAATGAATRRTGPPPGLSANGKLLWQFEALLHDVFGSRRPYASSASYNANFACAGNTCFPHAKWDPYVYTFANARHSRFVLRSRTFQPGSFGNYPVPLRINGLYIACNRNATSYLTAVGGVAGFALSCEKPMP